MRRGYDDSHSLQYRPHYVRHCAVTLVSLFENNPKETFTVHIIARELSETDRNILTALAGKYNNKACYYTPDAQMLEGFTIRATHNRLSLAAYYRCFLSALLPEDIDRVLYLDCDIVILGDITPLWRTPLDAHTGVAVVEDTGCSAPVLTWATCSADGVGPYPARNCSVMKSCNIRPRTRISIPVFFLSTSYIGENTISPKLASIITAHIRNVSYSTTKTC